MRVFVAANNALQPRDAATTLNIRCRTLFPELEDWIRSQEANWGECYIFLEVPLPESATPSGSHNQIDLLLSFPDRAAVCEIKSSAFLEGYALEMSKLIRQTDGQQKWLGRLLREHNFDARCLCFNVLAPLLGLNDIRALARNLVERHSAHHVWPIGAQPELKHTFHHTDKPFYLTAALESRLSGARPEGVFPSERPGLHEFFRQAIASGEGAELLDFESFVEAWAYLNSIPNGSPFLMDKWYVSGLRAHERDHALNILRERGVVVLVGPPEMGKTTLAKEIITESRGEYTEVSLLGSTSVRDLCHKLHAAGPADYPVDAGEETLLQGLLQQDRIFWVREFDEASARSLADVLHKGRAAHEAQRSAARWIIESTHPFGKLTGCDVTLAPCDRQQLGYILGKLTSGGLFRDPELVVGRAEERPGYAVRLWLSETAQEADAPDQYNWFRDRLSRDEADALALLCFAASRTPFGFTLESLHQWCETVFPHKVNNRKTILALLEKLEDRRLADVVRLDRGTLDFVLGAVLPEDCSLTVINNVAPGLIGHALNATSADVRSQWRQSLQNELFEAAASDYSLSHITFELLDPERVDLEPFFRSPFRFSYLGRFVSWSQDMGLVPSGRRQVYLYKALQILRQIGRHQADDLELELAPPEATDAVQRFAFEVVQTRADLSVSLDDQFDLQAWRRDCDQLTDAHLWAEKHVAAAMSLQHSGRQDRDAEAWSLFQALLARGDLGLTGRCYAVYETLAFLNRSKDAGGVVDQSVIAALIPTLARELVRTALDLQNVQLVCDGLFYVLRSQELGEGKRQYSKVLRHLNALSFIERTQGRTVRRMQVLLTMGSVYRHSLRDDALPWEVAQQHLNAGWQFNLRAYRSAAAHRHPRHMLNAATYTIDFCRKALRYAGEAAAREAILGKVREALPVCQEVECRFTPDQLIDKERELLENVRLGMPMLLYLKLVSEEAPATDEIAALRDRLRAQVDVVLKNAARGRRGRKQSDGPMNFLIGLHRSFVYGREECPLRHEALLRELEPDLIRLLSNCRPLKDGNGNSAKPIPAWVELANMLPPFCYAAYNLALSSRERLLNAFKPEFAKVFAHHVTHHFGVRYDAPPPPRARIEVVGYVCNDGLQVAIVEVNGTVKRPDGGLYHITISLDPERYRPNDANELLSRGWQRVTPLPLSVWPAIN